MTKNSLQIKKHDMKTVYFFRQKGSAYAFIGTTRSIDMAFSGFDTYSAWECYIVGTITHIAADEIMDIIRNELAKKAHCKPGFYAITDAEIEAICQRYANTSPDWRLEELAFDHRR